MKQVTFTKRGIPIVLIHTGVYQSVFWALKQAQSTNPNSEVILISELEDGEVAGVKYLPTSDYSKQADVILKDYVHVSNYSKEFEAACFKRWFLLNTFMKTHGVNRVFYIDSDVLLFSDISELHAQYANCDLTLATGINGECAHASYFNSQWVVEELCKKILLLFDMFKSEDLLNAGKAFIESKLIKYLTLERTFYPLNDMRALSLLKREAELLVMNSCEIINEGTFDYALLEKQSGYDTEGEAKRIQWQGAYPYCLHRRYNRMVRFHAIHYQGGTRGIMKRDFCHAQGIAIDSIPDCTVQSLATRK